MSVKSNFERIRKRDGRIVEFDAERITLAVNKALKAVGTGNEKLSKTICSDVIAALNGIKVKDDVPDIDLVQDLVEQAFIRRGLTKAAKSFILYRAQHDKMREGKKLMMDVQDLVSSYIEQNDWRVNENSNAGYSYASLLNHVSGSVVAHYTLSNIYPKEIANAHRDGDFHLHDLSCGIVGYCAGWSLRQLLTEGFKGCEGRASAGPAKHFDTALGQIVNFMCTLQTEWAGAQAFNSFDTMLAPFVREDNLGYKEIKQNLQQFVFGLNIASRWGQTPFTNLTFDWVIPEDLRQSPIIIGGKLQDGKFFGDYQKEMDLINKAFLEVMSAGDRDGRIFTFPIPTYNITNDFDWDSENAKLLFKVTGKYGLPYFQNFIKSDLKPGDVRSMCCRLQMDIRELRNKTGGLFGAGEQTGSIGVVTINMPRIGYLAKSESEFFSRLGNLMDMARDSMEIKRKIVQRHLDGDLLPYTKTYLGTLKNHFSTIGLVGLNEACLNFKGCCIADREGMEFSLKVLDYMRERISDYQAQTGHIYNLEATPAEGTSYRLARIDKKKYPEIICAGDSDPYYTNSSQLPVGYTDDIFDALDIQEPLQSKYTGGTVFHGFVGERIEDENQVAALVKRIAENYKIPYFTITPTFSICPVHGYIPGEHHECPLSAENEPHQLKIMSA
ncbi:MAG TPA: ribonucleoside triphosphate reductase [Lentisphaeria bacterium]|nr:MAG: ribonucleoside triphosphate reductase [Lentisphaerae bacterium GWF2_49_21]HBC88051.1 ribonucleoside triphosphate reductase [Lentisphaeria bacterium]